MWWITSVFVDSEYRRRGCFKRLYEHARREAVREGVAGIRVYTVNDNIAAQDTVRAVSLLYLAATDLSCQLRSLYLWQPQSSLGELAWLFQTSTDHFDVFCSTKPWA